ncbi:MAG: hypothetical protein Q9181_002718 [Wetmoreana brouardii]
MAPRIGRKTSYRQAQSHTTKGDVPPANLASQIADRLATGHQSPNREDRQSLQLLLQEVFEADDNAWQNDGSPGADATVNCRLIYVIVQAGLGIPPIVISAGEQQRRIADVVRSLQAVDLTVSRSPDALSQPLDVFVPQTASRFPLFAWLIPKLLDTIRNDRFHDIEQHVLKIIRRSISWGQRRETRSHSLHQLQAYIQACITDLLSTIETPEASKDGSFSLHGHSVPTPAAVTDIFSNHHAMANDCSTIQFAPRSTSHALMILMTLLLGCVPQMDAAHSKQQSDWPAALREPVLSNLRRFWTVWTGNVSSASDVSDACLRSLLQCSAISATIHCWNSKNELSGTPSSTSPKAQLKGPRSSRSSEANSFVFEHGRHSGANTGSRKRLRLDHETIHSNSNDGGGVDVRLEEQVLQALRLSVTESLFEVGPSTMYINIPVILPPCTNV